MIIILNNYGSFEIWNSVRHCFNTAGCKSLQTFFPYLLYSGVKFSAVQTFRTLAQMGTEEYLIIIISQELIVLIQ